MRLLSLAAGGPGRIAVMIDREESVGQLYVRVDRIGEDIGSALLTKGIRGSRRR